MNYFIMSDIHGSILYLNETLKNYNESFDKIIILGDVLYHGPRNDLPDGYNPKEVIKVLNSLKDKIICVKGNCDAEVDQMVLDFPIQDDYTFEINNKIVYCVHGHHLDFDNIKKYEADIVLYGHFHIPLINEQNGVLLVNSGSISIPKSDFGRTFMVLNTKGITINDINNKVIMKYDF